ncbi:MAG: hypothetical protein ABL920_07120 [Methylotenera sp.]|nr:hypothetical protein [Methylotenera sp.]
MNTRFVIDTALGDTHDKADCLSELPHKQSAMPRSPAPLKVRVKREYMFKTLSIN